MSQILGKKAGYMVVAGLLACVVALPAQAETLKFWSINFTNKSELHAVKSIIKAFESRHPGTNIKLVTRGVDAHKAALRVALDSGHAPDIYFSWAGLGLGGGLVRAGLAAPMDKYYKKYNWEDRFISEALSFSRYKDHRYGVPFTFRGEALYINKALFKKAGITELPHTYKQLIAAANKLVAANIAPITFGGANSWHTMRLMDVLLETKCGAKTHDALMNMKLDWSNQQCVTEAFGAFQKWTSKYVLEPFMGIDYMQSFNLYLAGQAAMMLEGDWLVSQLVGSGKEQSAYMVVPFPTGTNRLYGFSEYLYISSKSEHKDMAAKFLNYLTSTPVQQKYLGDFGTISVNKHVEYKNPVGPLTKKWVQIFRKTEGVFINGDQAFPLEVTEGYWRVIDSVALGKLDPSEAAAKMQHIIEQYESKNSS